MAVTNLEKFSGDGKEPDKTEMLAIEWKSINCQHDPDYNFGLFSVNAGLFLLREKVVEVLLDLIGNL